MPRSSHPQNIFRDPNPADRPFMVGRLPSLRGGNLLNTRIGYDPDGRPTEETTVVGKTRDEQEPFFYLYIFGGTMSMSQQDMHECVEEMIETRKRKRQQDPRPVPNWREIQNQVGDFIEMVKDARVGRKRFGT